MFKSCIEMDVENLKLWTAEISSITYIIRSSYHLGSHLARLLETRARQHGPC